MNDNKFIFNVNHLSDTPKYQQVINAINDAVSENLLVKVVQFRL